jgi:hypothetical protein
MAWLIPMSAIDLSLEKQSQRTVLNLCDAHTNGSYPVYYERSDILPLLLKAHGLCYC